jgi:2'-hydroxyisoflavone reductase
VYPEGGEYDESAALVPSNHPNPYSAQKADSERALIGLHRTRGVPIATLRPAFVYGPHNPFDREAFFWDRILAGRPVIVPEDGSATMQWVHARDVARAAIRAAEAPEAVGRAYNLGSYPPISQLDFVKLLSRVAGREPRIAHVPRGRIVEAGGELFRPPFYFGVYLDIPPITVIPDRARAELGIELTPLEEGLRETFEWYRQQQRPQPDFTWEDRLLAAAAPAVGD